MGLLVTVVGELGGRAFLGLPSFSDRPMGGTLFGLDGGAEVDGFCPLLLLSGETSKPRCRWGPFPGLVRILVLEELNGAATR
jgi:hypothetical protein